MRTGESTMRTVRVRAGGAERTRPREDRRSGSGARRGAHPVHAAAITRDDPDRSTDQP
jgi:hypothetical protein